MYIAIAIWLVTLLSKQVMLFHRIYNECISIHTFFLIVELRDCRFLDHMYGSTDQQTKYPVVIISNIAVTKIVGDFSIQEYRTNIVNK